MLILGLEATAHTFGAGIVESDSTDASSVSRGDTKVLSNEIAKYPSVKEGYIPRKLAEHHAKHCRETIAAAFAKANARPKDLDAVAYSQGPGIGHCLHVGYVAAKSLSTLLGIPLVPVNHTIAHVEVGRWWCGARDPLVVYVAGGNTQIAARVREGNGWRYRVFGETLDIGLGNFLDLVGRKLELEPPDAVGVLKAAANGRKFVRLPYTVKGMNLAYSGMLTALERIRGVGSIAEQQDEDLCFSAQETAFAALVEASERCLCHTRNPEVLLCGGNARNRRLQEMLRLMSEEQRARFCVTPDEYSGDQAGMIALTGLLQYLSGTGLGDAEPRQKMRLDSRVIRW